MQPIDAAIPAYLRKGQGRKRHPQACYEKAAHYISCHFGDESVRLVHGRVVPNGDWKIRYAHAWVEIGDAIVFDGVEQHFYDREDYYREMEPVVEAMYAPHEAAGLISETRHSGRWRKPTLGTPEPVDESANS